MSSFQLHNYLMTLKIDPSSCRGFEDEALGACIGLVGWGWAGSTASRMSWMRAVTVAAMNRSGGLTAGPKNKSFFYVALQHRQIAAFQSFGFSDPDWSRFDCADYPWALPEPLFRALDAEVSQGKGLAGDRAVTWEEVIKTVTDYKLALGLGPLGWVGKKMFKSFLLKYAPEFAEGALAEWGAGVFSVAAFAAIRAEQKIVPISNEQTKRAFEADRNRRNYDKATEGAMAAR